MLLYKSIYHHSQFKSLGAFYLHSVIRLFVLAIFHLFNGIYINQVLINLGLSSAQALSLTALVFALIFLVHSFSVAPVLWLINKKGLRFCIFWGNLFLIGFYLFLLLAKYDPIFFIVAAICGGLQQGLYWTAYHIYFVELSDDKKQGEEISLSTALTAISSIGAPAFGGLLISYGGYELLFVTVSILLILALVPLRYIPQRKDHVPINILETIKLLSPKREMRSFISLASFGITQMTMLVFWPLLVVSIVGGVVGIGFMGSLVGLIAAVTTFGIGYLIDRLGSNKIINLTGILDSILWILRVFVVTPLQVFITSALAALINSGKIVALETLVYHRARHKGIAAIIVQREIGISIGIFLYMLALGLLFWFGFPPVGAFFISAGLSLLIKLYPETKV